MINFLITSLFMFSFPAYSNEVYLPTFNIEYFGSYIGRDLKKDLRNHSLEQKREEIWDRLNINSTLYEEYSRQLPLTSESEMFIQDAYIDVSIYDRSASENWMAAWSSLLEETVLNKPEGAPYPHFVEDQHLIEKLRKYLPSVASDEVTDIKVISKSTPNLWFESYRYSKDEDIRVELKFRTYQRRLERIASPLFIWLLKQPNKSVSPLDLFKKAKEIYSDSWTALGVISYLTMCDATGAYVDNRKKQAVASFKMQSIFENANDHAGTIYHFWGYLIRSVLKNEATMDNFRSFLHEELFQGDHEDRAADKLGLSLGKNIINYIQTSTSNTIHF